jgi:hypothetical protein
MRKISEVPSSPPKTPPVAVSSHNAQPLESRFRWAQILGTFGFRSKSYQTSLNAVTPADLGALQPRLRLAAVTSALPFAAEPETTLLSATLIRLALPPRRVPPASPLIALWQRIAKPALDAIWSQRQADAAAARVEVTRFWPWLPTPARAAALEAFGGMWAAPVRAAAADANAAIRRGAADLAAASDEPGLLGEVLPLLSDPDPSVAAAAEQAFESAAEQPRAGPRARETERQVAAALACYDEHRRPGTLAAAIRLADTALLARAKGETGPLVALLSDPAQAFQMPLRAHFRRARDPMTRARAWIWLGRGFAPVALLDRLGRADSPADHEAVLTRMHLIEHPKRRELARRVKPRSPGALTPDALLRAHLSVASRRGLARWVEAVDLPADTARATIESLLADVDPGVRLAAMRSAAPRALDALVADRDPRIAAAALRRVSSAGMERRRAASLHGPTPEALAGLADHPAAAVRTLAAQEHERLAPWTARSPAGRLEARRRLRESPVEFRRQLRNRLLSPPTSLDAALLIRALGLAVEFEADLVSVLEAQPAGEDGRIAPTVLATLGELGTERAGLVVRAHLNDTRPRLRANAVEAVARQSHRDRSAHRADILIELKADPDHRVRANAIRGLFRGGAPAFAEQPAAFDALGLMLTDPRSAHRIAGIWVAGRVLAPMRITGRKWTDLAGQLTDLATTDPDPGARARANRASARVLAGLREGWRTSAADVVLSGASTLEHAA